MDSILETIRHMVAGGEQHEYFDTDLIIFINSAIATLRQLGIGPQEGFAITGTTDTWEDFLGVDTSMLETVKAYIALKVRLMFDPTTSSAVTDSIKSNIAEMEWRLNTTYETGA